MANENVQFFLRAVNERFEKFRTNYAALLTAFSAGHDSETLQAVSDTLEALDHVLAIISEKDWPPWAGPLRTELHKYQQNSENKKVRYALLRVLLNQDRTINLHKWSFETTDAEIGVDFEATYAEHYKNSKGPALFQALLEQLQKIVDSGEVDSLKAITSLRKLIATIRANMRGTYFQTVGLSHFVFAVIRNYLWKSLKGIPAIGDLLGSVEDTLKELDAEMSEVHVAVRKELAKYAQGEVEAIEYQSHSVEALPSKGERGEP